MHYGICANRLLCFSTNRYKKAALVTGIIQIIAGSLSAIIGVVVLIIGSSDRASWNIWGGIGVWHVLFCFVCLFVCLFVGLFVCWVVCLFVCFLFLYLRAKKGSSTGRLAWLTIRLLQYSNTMDIVFFVFQLYVVSGILGVVSKNQNKRAVRLFFYCSSSSTPLISWYIQSL